MSNISIGNLNDNYFSIDFAGKTDPTDTYRFNQLNTGSFRVTAEGFSSIVGMQLLDSQGKVVKDIETNGTNSGTFSIDNLGATNYALKISAPSGDTNYQVSLTPDGKVDPLTGLGVDSGFFATDSTGKVGFDWLHDGGNYQGEVAIFSVQGMEKFTPGSEEFIKEAARRVLSNSLFGHVVISDPTESANPLFNGSLGEGNDNQGQYSGRKTFAMKPGEAFAVMLVPNGTVQEVFNNPNAGGDKRPLLSLSSANPNDAWLYGQVADVTGSGKAFAMEDQRVDTGSDKDYNDLVFNLTGATGKAVSIDKVIDPAKDWTKLDGGKKLIDYVKSKQPIVEPPVAVGLPVQTKPPVAVGPPIETKPPVAVTPPVATGPVETKPPVAVAPAVETPSVETKPPVAVAPPVETPPVAVAPPIETTPSVATLPVATTPPVATLPIAPPIPPVQPPTIAPEAPLLGLGPIDDLSQPIDPERPIEPVLPISSPPENRAFIGIFDTGFATNNPDLDYSKVTLGRDRIDKDSNPLFTAGTGNEHGTFSWGLVSAIQGNDKGIDGYNDKANVYLSRAIGSGEWDLALTDFVGEAKAQKQKNAIALLPLDLTQKNADGSITTRYEFTPRERAALENARQNGVLLVVAAGNDGGVMSVLGQSSQEFENILTVGSSDGFGRSDYSSYGYGLDILVPGGAIDNPTLSTVGDDLGTMAGTSAAAAIAAGMASKVWESNPNLNPTQVIDVLTGSAIDLKEPGWDEETGFGVMNLNKAVQLAKETAPQAYIPTPFSNPTTWGLEGLVTPLERATADQFNGKYYDWESYTIQDGDTLSQIAIDTMGDSSPDFYNFIAQHNNIPNPDEIYAGQEIQIPKEVSAPQQQPPTNDNPNVDFNPDNPNVDFNPDNNPNVNFNPDDNPNVGFNPDNPNVDFNPDDNPNVDFNPDDNPNVDFNPDDNSNVDFNPPQSNSINLNGYTIGGNFYPVFQNYEGTLGNPTSDVINYNGLSYQLFENGSIVSSANGTFPLYGGIRQTYRNTGGLEGWLGAPTSEEKGLGDGNIIQYFEHGHIYWNGSKAVAYKEGTPVPKTPLNIGSQLGVTKPSSGVNNGGVNNGGGNNGGVNNGGGNNGGGNNDGGNNGGVNNGGSLNADQSSSASTTLRFELNDASLWDTQGSGFGLDFDAQFTVKPENKWPLLFGMEAALEASFDANIYGFLSAGTVDLGLSGDFQVKTTTDGMTGKTTLSVNTANLNPDSPYMSTYLGFGAGLGVSAGVKASLKNIPGYGDISGEIGKQFNLTAEQLMAKLLLPAASEFGEVDLGFKLNTNLWKNDNELEADDTAGLKLNINKLGQGQIPDFLKLSVDLGVKQTSTAKLAGFWFDPDNIDGNPGDFYVPLGQSGGTKDPLGFIPQALRVRPDLSIETNFAALAKGSVSVGVSDAIKNILGNKMPDGILGNVLGNLPLDMGLSREVGIPISSVSTKPFTNSGYWNSISLMSGNTPSGNSYGYNT